MNQQDFWDAAYLRALSALMADAANDGETADRMASLAADMADKSLVARQQSIAARSPEPEPAKPAGVKRGASTRQPCPGGGEKRSPDAGYLKCNGCGRVVGTSRGRGGWYAAEHKLPAEVGT